MKFLKVVVSVISSPRSFIVGVVLPAMLFMCQPAICQDTENYCHDQDSWKEWDALVQKYPNDLDVQTLHALRLGLCAKIERGDLSVEDAIDIFERARKQVLLKKQNELQSSDKNMEM